MTRSDPHSINPEDMLNEINCLNGRVQILETMTARLLAYVMNTGNAVSVREAGLDQKSVLDRLKP